MTKAFDLNDLKEKLAAKGLPMTEVLAETVATEVFAWVKESGAIHPNTIVKLAVPLVMTVIEPAAFAAINKIDGKEG